MLLATARANAQTGSPIEGAPEFVLPIGARAIGMGQAAVATAIGIDGLWWNPAVISRGPREASLSIGRTFATSDGGADAGGGVIIPVRGVGAFGVSIRYLNEGQSAATDSVGNQIGVLSIVGTVLAGTFAAPFGDRFAAGVTIKFLQLSFPCTGTCNAPTTPPRTGAFDLGGQYFVTKDSLVTLGAAVRSVGLKLQVNDSPQADPLPSRFDGGIAIAPKFAEMPKEARVRLAADVVTRLGAAGGGPGYRFGGEVSWLERLQARAGYVVNGPTGSGLTLGLGFSTGRLQVDFAQARTDFSDSGTQPTFLTLRYIF